MDAQGKGSKRKEAEHSTERIGSTGLFIAKEETKGD